MISLVASLTACAHTTRVKIYVSRPEKGGIERAQAKELIKYQDTAKYFCVSPEDMEIWITEMGEQYGGDR